MLRTAELDYKYPEELVATSAKARGTSRILKIPRDNENFEEIAWEKFLAHFKTGDTLVLNDSRVLWARLLVPKASGATGEIFFLKNRGNIWEVLTKGLNIKEGKILDLPGDVKGKVIKHDRICELEIVSGFSSDRESGSDAFSAADMKEYFEKFGQVPLPPYIEQARAKFGSESAESDRERYQNVWAKSWGSVAAPTAGLHFSEKHLADLKKNGVNIAYITLHVGAGTFLPIQTDGLEDFQIHSEVVRVPRETCEVVLKSQAAGKRIWACGTTALRALETAVHASPSARSRLPLIAPFLGETKLFVTPGYRFLVVDGLLTNFHQPQSSLLALAAAFATRRQPMNENDKRAAVQKILKAYSFAIQKKFRLFSYGDLTMIV